MVGGDVMVLMRGIVLIIRLARVDPHQLGLEPRRRRAAGWGVYPETFSVIALTALRLLQSGVEMDSVFRQMQRLSR